MSAQDRLPEDIRCAQDYESVAGRFLAAPVHAYIAGGSGSGRTLEANRTAFDKVAILPRLLRDVREGHTRLSLLGRELAHPVLLAPVAFQSLAHPHGELETARAAAASDSCMVCSTLSSFPLEEVAAHAGTERWFQLYLQPHRDDTLDLVRRAEAAGYSALALTLDATIQTPSLRALRAGFRMPAEARAANLAGYRAAAQPALPRGASRIFQGAMAAAPNWDDLAWLADRTSLPLLVKGVLHPGDALSLKAAGVAGLVVSNHGGRTIDDVPASLDALPAIRGAVGDGYPLLLDGGVRCGADVFKAIALGADAVMIGRLQVYALAAAGALGVAHLVRLLREELEICMAAAGRATLDQIDASAVVR